MERETSTITLKGYEFTHYTDPVKGDVRELEALMTKTLNSSSRSDLQDGNFDVDVSKIDTIELGNLQLRRFIKSVKTESGQTITDSKKIAEIYDNMPLSEAGEIDLLMKNYFNGTNEKEIEKK